MAFSQLPNVDFSRNPLDVSPLTDAIRTNQQLNLQKNRLAQDEERLGFERQLQPLRVQSTQQQLDSAKASEARTAQMHPLQLTQAEQQVSAGEDEAAKRKAGLHYGFIDSQFNPASPNYEPDAAKRTEKWNKYLPLLKGMSHLDDPEIGPLIRNPDTGWQIVGGIAKGYQKDTPTFGDIGVDAYGQPRKGWIDTTRQTVRPAEPEAVNPAGPTASGPTGEEFLKGLPKPMADQVKGIAEGRIAFPSGFALKTPYWQRMVSLVSQYDPNFDSVNYNARNKTRADFTAGKSAQNITAFNTAIQHLDTLYKSVDGLENGSYPKYNAVANAVRSNVDPQFAARVKDFESARTAVTDELTRAFRGAGGNVHDIEQWEKNINSADSPEALRAVVKSAIELLNGRLEAVADQYNRGMGTTKQPLELLSPKAQEAVARMKGKQTEKLSAVAEDAPSPQVQRPEQPAVTKEKLLAMPDGPVDLGGQRFMKRGSQLIPLQGDIGSPGNPYGTKAEVQKPGQHAYEGGKIYKRTPNYFADRWEEVPQ